MRTPTKILTSFTSYNNAAFIQKAELIVDSMTDNASFATPIPSLTEVRTAIDTFGAAIVKAGEGGQTDRLARDQKRTDLVALLQKLALYVQMESNNDEVVLASSGFTLRKTPEPIGILAKPKNFVVVPVNRGMIKASLNSIYGAKSYLFEYRRVGEEPWTVVAHTKSSLLLNSLDSGREYEFRVAGVGAAPQKIYSESVRSFTL
ncbi:hypothetical protein [Sinomicrobium sp. M5D2P9]